MTTTKINAFAMPSRSAKAGNPAKKELTATFAGGCFWCMEAAFKTLPGVEVVSGYTGGSTTNPTYEEVSSGSTGHFEAVQVRFDTAKTSYSEILDHYWKSIDPSDPKGQFADRGQQYRTAIFYHNKNQKKMAEASAAELEKTGLKIATQVLPAKEFYPAERHHQDYSTKNPIRYNIYKQGTGRAEGLKHIWKRDLTPMQKEVAQNNRTEPAFQNEYWDNNREGIYVDIITGEALFSSKDKYDSGTGWPSFTKHIDKAAITQKKEGGIFGRTEVRTNTTHLGHVFDDGPTGKRYCINSASLKFIPKEKLEKEGYKQAIFLVHSLCPALSYQKVGNV